MFISKKFVFMELHKTGCTHIRHLLNELIDGELVGGHNQASSNLFDEERVFLGSIRDPWDWYTSLWAYGCDNKGSVFNSTTKVRPLKFESLNWKNNTYSTFLSLISNRAKHPQKWLETYADVNDAEAFRAWLSMMQNPRYFIDIREGYAASPISRSAGLLTFRYLKLFCTKSGDSRNLNALSSFKKIKDYESTFCFIDRFIRNENLEYDLFQILEDFSAGISDEKKTNILLREKRNTSSKKHGTEYYYDKKSENLVAKRERLIIERFNYLRPSLRHVS